MEAVLAKKNSVLLVRQVLATFYMFIQRTTRLVKRERRKRKQSRPFAASYSRGTKRNRHAGEQRTHWDVTNGSFLCLSCPIDLLQFDLS